MVKLLLNSMQVEDLIRLVNAQCKRVSASGDGPYWAALHVQLRESLNAYRFQQAGAKALRKSSTP